MLPLTLHLFHWAAAAAAWAIGGTLWAAMTFLAIACVRLALAVLALRQDNAELLRRLEELSPESLPTDLEDVASLRGDALGTDAAEDSPTSIVRVKPGVRSARTSSP